MSNAGKLSAIPILSHVLLVLVFITGVDSATFTIVNNCAYNVWPGLLSNAGTPQPSTTGFALKPGQSNTVSVPESWSGRLWGRTLCTQDPTTAKFTCGTGDCGSSNVQCSGSGAVPPATLAEFTLDGAGGLDFYDVSLVDGFNLPMSVVPQGGKGGNCSATGCAVDLNAACPKELQVDDSEGSAGSAAVACKSACNAFGDPKYCCSGAYSTPNTCKPSTYSEIFKSACPTAYSYAYDDGTSTFTCASANYVITFCPSPSTSVKTTGNEYTEAADSPAATATRMASASQASAAGHTWSKPPTSVVALALVTSLAAVPVRQLRQLLQQLLCH